MREAQLRYIVLETNKVHIYTYISDDLLELLTREVHFCSTSSLNSIATLEVEIGTKATQRLRCLNNKSHIS